MATTVPLYLSVQYCMKDITVLYRYIWQYSTVTKLTENCMEMVNLPRKVRCTDKVLVLQPVQMGENFLWATEIDVVALGVYSLREIERCLLNKKLQVNCYC